MEFADKYDLLEALTSGAVETFVANDKRRNERVLVHILHCEPQRPNQPTIQWVLEGFRKVAPEPVGLVLDTGKYSGTLYAYLVTKLPEDAALKSWIQEYSSRKTDTHEIPASPAPPPEAKAQAPAHEHVTAEMPIPPKESARVPVQFTQMFREFGSQPKATPPTAAPQEAEPALRGVPSLDDPEHPSGLQAAPVLDTFAFDKASAIKPEPPQSTSSAKAPDRFFSSEFSVKNFPSDPPAPPKASVKAGEFTSFFQGPFRPDAPSEVPPLPSTPIETRQKPVGAFTEMFGAVTSKPESPMVSSGPEKKPSGSGFTGWFSDPDILSRAPETPSSAPPTGSANDAVSVFPAPPKETLPASPALPPPPVSAPAPPVFPIPTPVVTRPPIIPSVPSTPEGATRAFSSPTIEPVPLQPAPLSGPSPYTQVISMRPPAPADEAETEASERTSGGGGSAIKLPEIKPPKIMAPKIEGPKIQGPKIQGAAIQGPKIQAPKIQAPKIKVPKLEEPKPPVSYWPLVITLTVLFGLAVLLVLYFVLKH